MMASLSDCKKSPSSAASVIVSNFDMLTQILLRLPVKSLFVFKSVSKQWFSLISDPFFINKYNILQNSLPIQGLYTQTRAGASPELKYIPLDGSSSYLPFKTLGFISNSRIVQSCNGLIGCYAADDDLDVYPTYYICNPFTRKYCPIVCESQKHEKGFQKLSSVSLAYDPLKSPHYKVVCIWLVSKLTSLNFNYQIEIYSSETASWKLSGEVFSRHCRSYSKSGVFCNGSLHWIEPSNVGSLYYFNVDRELRLEMEMPIYDEELGMGVVYFGECKGHMYLIVSPVTNTASIEILEMETDYTGWNKKYIVDLHELLLANPSARYKFDVLLVKEIEGESPNLVLRVSDKVIYYDLQDMNFKEIQLPALAPGAVYQYIQTLACV